MRLIFEQTPLIKMRTGFTFTKLDKNKMDKWMKKKKTKFHWLLSLKNMRNVFFMKSKKNSTSKEINGRKSSFLLRKTYFCVLRYETAFNWLNVCDESKVDENQTMEK